ncbi:MAG: DUF1501 domain-containing protein [Planctomycetota bacterium]
MNNHWNECGCNPPVSRREMLWRSSAGFAGVALAGLLGVNSKAEGSDNPLAPKAPHFPARAKRVIFLFMHGGPSQVDTFDPKPLLDRDDGKPLPFAKPRVQFAATGNLMRSPWKFKKYGQSGIEVSELFPHVAEHVDDLCVINSMHGSNSAHGGALLKLHTGSDNFIRPSMGSWITYGLGSENQSLPGFVTICPSLGHGGLNNWSSAFLPASYQGTPIGHSGMPSEKAAISFIKNSETTPDLQRMQLDLLQAMNGEKKDDALDARIKSFELAYRMQTAAPELQDISKETPETLKLYGLDHDQTKDFGRQCLMARRFAERGVRFVQVSHSYKWDQHGSLRKDHAKNALEVDKPIAGLLKDLKDRGLLHDTLVLWGGEFGRTPTQQGGDGRDHNPDGFTMWMAGGGVKPGHKHGATDDYGYYAVQDKVHIHDLHATILHLLGLDHLKLTYTYAGRPFRLTDVAGDVVHDIIA